LIVYTVYITPPAIDDIDDGVNYYNKKSEYLGFKFADEIDVAFKSISKNPFAFGVRYRDVRGKLLKKFPYLILYRVNDEMITIEVLRIFNTYQNPYWL